MPAPHLYLQQIQTTDSYETTIGFNVSITDGLWYLEQNLDDIQAFLVEESRYWKDDLFIYERILNVERVIPDTKELCIRIYTRRLSLIVVMDWSEFFAFDESLQEAKNSYCAYMLEQYGCNYGQDERSYRDWVEMLISDEENQI